VTEGRVAETTFYVRYAETDQMGVVHHSEYIVWFEEGRSAWMRAIGSNYADFEAGGLNLMVTEVHVRFLAPARYGRQVTVRSRVDELRSRTLRFSYQVVDTDSGRVLVKGYTRHVCVDGGGRVVRIPQRWCELFSQVTQSDPIQSTHLRPAALHMSAYGDDGSSRTAPTATDAFTDS
jgi:acyl-CoA thioester hydrolase